MIGLIICIVLIIVAIILYSSNMRDKTDNYSTYDTFDNKSTYNETKAIEKRTQVENKQYSTPGEVAEPISVKRTLVKSTTEQHSSISVTKSMYDVQEHFDNILPFKYKQYHTYKIKGLNSKTNRRKTLTIAAFNEDDLKQRAEKKELLEPYEITLFDTPITERQASFIRNLGMSVKSEYTLEDASCIISRTYEREPAAEQWLLTFAMGHNIPFSLYATSGNVMKHIRNEYFVDIVHEIAFGVFAINRHANSDDVFYESRFIGIAETLNKDDDFMRLYEKTNIDYMRPNSRTVIYKKVIEALNEN